MTHHDLPSGTGPILENLMNRQGLLRLMQESHLRWMHHTHDPHIQEIHRNLAAQLEIVLEQYDILIEALQSHR